MIDTDLEASYQNVILVQVIEEVDRLLRQGSETRCHSIALTEGWNPRPRLADLKGLGKAVWADEDAQEYVKRLREQWRR